MAEMTGMTARGYYISVYDELPEAVRTEMRRVFDTGVNNSGVWVRFKEVENLVGVMAYEYTYRPVATNADRIRAMSDEELAMIIMCPTNGKCPTLYPSCYECALNWLQSQVGEVGDGD